MLLTLLEHGTAKETGAPPVLPSGQHGPMTRSGHVSDQGPERRWYQEGLDIPGIEILESSICGGFSVLLCLFVCFCVFLVAFYWGKIGKMKMNSINPSYQVKQTAHQGQLRCFHHMLLALSNQDTVSPVWLVRLCPRSVLVGPLF